MVLLLRYSLGAKLVYFGQTVDPALLEPFARRFDAIVLRTSLKLLEIDQISEDQNCNCSSRYEKEVADYALMT